MFIAERGMAIVLKRSFKGTRKVNNCNRSKQAKRLISIMIALGTKQYTLHQLSIKFEMCQKTIRRDLRAIEEMGVPLICDSDYFDYNHDNEISAQMKRGAYRIDRYWMKRFI